MSTNPKLNFRQGLLCIPKGFKEILFDYKVFLNTLIPLILGLILIYFGFYYGWDWTTVFLKKQLVGFLSQWMSENSYLFKIIFSIFNFISKILFTIVVIYFGFILIQIISIPFYTLSCERILVKRGVFPDREFDFWTWIRLNLRLLVLSIIRMMIFLFFGFIVFVFSFIPGLQFLAMIYSGYVMALDSIDYTLEIYEMGLGRRFVLYFKHLKFFLGVAVVLFPTLFIPGLTLLFLPITVVGSAVCFAEAEGKKEYEKLIA